MTVVFEVLHAIWASCRSWILGFLLLPAPEGAMIDCSGPEPRAPALRLLLFSFTSYPLRCL